MSAFSLRLSARSSAIWSLRALMALMCSLCSAATYAWWFFSLSSHSLVRASCCSASTTATACGSQAKWEGSISQHQAQKVWHTPGSYTAETKLRTAFLPLQGSYQKLIVIAGVKWDISMVSETKVCRSYIRQQQQYLRVSCTLVWPGPDRRVNSLV